MEASPFLKLQRAPDAGGWRSVALRLVRADSDQSNVRYKCKVATALGAATTRYEFKGDVVNISIHE
jgi:hypothetical protein